jgi:hypothetical protein
MGDTSIKEDYNFNSSKIDTGMRIMIGIFSYNEGKNLERIYYQIKQQCTNLQCEIVLIDESDKQDSLNIVNKIMEKDNVRNIRKKIKKRGKVYGYNVLYDSFIDSDCNILLHFDADHLISENTISNLAVSINSGYNIATCFNKPFKTKNLFQRILNVLTFPAIYLRETGEFKYPLVGHNGAYDRKAVQCIGEIPSGGPDEETFILGKVLQNNLKYTIVTQSICYYEYPSNMNDYFRSIKRMYSRAKTSVKKYPNICQIDDSKGHKFNIVDLVYKRPSINIIITAVLSDPFASLFIPYVILIRWVAMHTEGIYTSDTWDSIESTKMLKI